MALTNVLPILLALDLCWWLLCVEGKRTDSVATSRLASGPFDSPPPPAKLAKCYSNSDSLKPNESTAAVSERLMPKGE